MERSTLIVLAQLWRIDRLGLLYEQDQRASTLYLIPD
jgi:hypothetical protein